VHGNFDLFLVNNLTHGPLGVQYLETQSRESNYMPYIRFPPLKRQDIELQIDCAQLYKNKSKFHVWASILNIFLASGRNRM
ncbi:9004_t:CDS:1, partial [Ambispora leptoticha]